MADGLQIRIAADVEAALRALKQVQKELDATANAGENAGKGAEAAGKGFTRLPQSANQATSAMINLNRVVQDAPYGFIGIANNLEQLFGSFQTLQSTTKNSGGALKALKDAISGPAGLAFGFSLLTAGLTFAQVGLSRWIGKSAEAKKSTDEATKALERYNEVQRLLGQDTTTVRGVAVGNTTAEISQVQSLAKIIKDQTLSYQQRNNALLELQKINKSYFGDLTLEQDSLSKLTSRVNEYSQALVAAEVVKLYKERVAQAAVSLNDQVEAERKLNAQLQVTTAEREAAEKAAKKQYNSERDLETSLTRLGKAQAAEKAIQSDLIKQGEKIATSQNALTKFNKELNNAVLLTTQFKPLTAPPPGEKLKADDFIELDVLGVEEEVRGFIFAFSKYMKQAAKENKVNLSEMFGDVQKDPFKNLSKAGKEIRDAFLPIQNWKGFEGLTQFQVDLANTGEMIANMLTPSLDAMIQAIGRGENAFKAFGEGVKGILLQVMQKLAATAILAGVLAALFPTGIGGSQGFGAIFGKLLGFKANGGPVGGGNPYIVGERGPELFVPSVSGSIVPNHQVGSFMGGRGSSGGGGSVLRGQDIILAYARTQRSQLRVNG